MRYAEALAVLNSICRSNGIIQRWCGPEDIVQEVLMSLHESGVRDGEITTAMLYRKKRQVYADKLKYAMREKRKDCLGYKVSSIDGLDIGNWTVDVSWESLMGCPSRECNIREIIFEYSQKIGNDIVARRFFENLAYPSEKLEMMWKERRARSNRTRNLDIIPPQSLLEMTGTPRSKYEKRKKNFLEYLTLRLEKNE